MSSERFELGVVLKLEDEGADNIIGKVARMGFTTCHISAYEPSLLTEDNAALLRRESERHGVRIDGFWAGWPGKVAWDFVDGPATIGIVPADLRAERVGMIKHAATFAATLGVRNLMTHLGFVPEVASDPVYAAILPAIREIGEHCGALGQTFCFETGQETPITLLRTIQDVGLDNLGVNLDGANLLMYGKGNPVDAVDTLGPWIRGVHVKDGRYPTDGRQLGREEPVGEGQVDFPTLLRKLAQHGYAGPLCIEYEVDSRNQVEAIGRAKARVEGWLKGL